MKGLGTPARGRDHELRLEAEAITNLKLPVAGIEEASCNVARFVDRSSSLLGCDSDMTACGPPRRGRPAAFKFDSDESERVESERAGGGCGESNHLPSQNASCQQTPPATPPPIAANVKASSTRAGFVPGRCEGTRRYAIKAWF